jgi:hypothetical protein
MNNRNDELSELEARLRAMVADEHRKTEARFEEIKRRVQKLEIETMGYQRQPFTEGDDGRLAGSSK